MQIIIPMSGFGKRFLRAGYTLPKPLIQIEGKPIIAHVIDMFPDVTNFTFICNSEHLSNPEFEMEATLKSYCKSAKIISIDPHALGPVHAVSQAFNEIDDSEPAIVNYCDFTCYWNYEDFKSFLIETDSDGCVPAYRGFHPHMLGPNNYAFIKDENGWLKDIQEKKPFTDDRSKEFASSGTYYFKSGELLKKYFSYAMENNLKTNDEYYVSMVYRPMAKDDLKISVYELQHFMQWGTPEDVAEYNCYSKQFRDLASNKLPTEVLPGSLLLPMAGLGSRYANDGYEVPKPLISVSGKPMVVQAALDLPHYKSQTFVVRKDLPKLKEVKEGIKEHLPEAKFIDLEELTDGQARTCYLASKDMDEDAPLTIGACDNGALYDYEKFKKLYDDNSVDLIVWGMRGHPGAAINPKMYGWLDVKGDTVIKASVKVPLSDPKNDPIIIGAFTFKKTGDFNKCCVDLFESKVTVNGEYYVDSLVNNAIKLGLNCKVFEIDSYPGWGTPDDLRVFKYWQSCFHKWDSHPYTLEGDSRVSNPEILIEEYKEIIPNRC